MIIIRYPLESEMQIELGILDFLWHPIFRAPQGGPLGSASLDQLGASPGEGVTSGSVGRKWEVLVVQRGTLWLKMHTLRASMIKTFGRFGVLPDSFPHVSCEQFSCDLERISLRRPPGEDVRPTFTINMWRIFKWLSQNRVLHLMIMHYNHPKWVEDESKLYKLVLNWLSDLHLALCGRPVDNNLLGKNGFAISV